LSYAELSSALPVSGGEYAYVKKLRQQILGFPCRMVSRILGNNIQPGMLFVGEAYTLKFRNAKKLRETESGIKNLEETLGERNLPYFRQR